MAVSTVAVGVYLATTAKLAYPSGPVTFAGAARVDQTGTSLPQEGR